MEHAGEEFDGGGFVGVGFVEGEEEFEGAVFEGRLRYERCGCSIQLLESQTVQRKIKDLPGPKMTAFQSMMLSGHGLPEMPPGGSLESRLKSRMRRLLQFVDLIASLGQSHRLHRKRDMHTMVS